MTDLEERTLKCYLIHTGVIADDLEFENWYGHRHQGMTGETEYKSVLGEANAWLTGWRQGWNAHKSLIQRSPDPLLAKVLSSILEQ